MFPLAAYKHFIIQFLKYGIVGLSGVVIDFAVTWFLKETGRFNKYIANTCGFVCAATSNYLFNRIWTFESDNPEILYQYFSFFMVSLIGLGINNLALWGCTDKLKWSFYLSKLVAIGITTLWNFTINYFFIF